MFDAANQAVYMPITLRCASLDAALDDPGLDDGLAQALARAFEHAASVIGQADRVALGPVELGREAAGHPRASELQSRVASIITQVAANRLPTPAPGMEAGVPAPAEPFDAERFDTVSADYVIPSYDGGAARVRVRRTPAEQFAELARELNITDTVIDDLINQLEAVGDSTPERNTAISRLAMSQLDVREAWHEIVQIVSVLKGETDPATLPDDLLARMRLQAARYRQGRRDPDPQLIARRIAELQGGRVYTAVIAERCGTLDAAAMTAEPSTPVRRGFFVVSAAYIEAGLLGLNQGQQRIAFLDTFYRDRRTIVGYAIAEWAWGFFGEFWSLFHESTRRGLSGTVVPKSISDWGDPAWLDPYPSLPSDGTPRERARDRVLSLLILLRNLIRVFGHQFPVVPAAIGDAVPSTTDAAFLAALVLHLAVDIPIMALFEPVEALLEMLYQVSGAGEHYFRADERGGWLDQLRQLQDVFSAEIQAGAHPDNADKLVQGWDRQVRDLVADIPKEVQRTLIISEAWKQIPLLLIGGEVLGAIGAVWKGSRWLRIIAEGIALTGINTIVTWSQHQKLTIGSIGQQLALNIGFAGLGGAFGAFAGDIGQALVGFRASLVRLGGMATAAVALASVQEAINAVERDVEKGGGDTDLTTVFTCDVALNVLAMLFGRGFQSKRAQLPKGFDPVDTVALARVLKISENGAGKWRQFDQRSADIGNRLRALGEVYRAGGMPHAEFERLKREALDLIDEMLPVVSELAPFLDGAPPPEVLRSSLQRMRSAIAATEATSLGPRLLTPSSTPGLVRVGDSQTYTFDPAAAQPERASIQKLAQALEQRGWQLQPAPDGGFRATLEGQPTISVLPAPPSVRGLLPAASLDSMAGGQPQASEGVVAIRQQSSVPGLDAMVAAAGATLPPGRMVSFLRLMRLIPLSQLVGRAPAAWMGLARYIELGGDLDVLTHVLSRKQSVEFRLEQINTTLALLERIADPAAAWDESAVRGLAALDRFVPHLGSERFSELVGNVMPVQLRGIMQVLDVLDRRTTGRGRAVVSGLAAEAMGGAGQIGAVAVLQNALQEVQRFPNISIGFEVPTPDVNETFVRIHDMIIYENVEDPVGGHPPTRREIFRHEIKDVLATSISAKVRRQFGRDVIQDYERRVAGGSAVRPPYASFGWRFARAKLLEPARRRLAANPTDGTIEVAMTNVVKERLRAAFDDPTVKERIPEPELQRYRELFEDTLPFVGFY